MYKSIAVTYENLGNEASDEIKSLTSSKTEILGPVVFFSAENPIEIARVAYFSQSFSSVGFMVAELKLSELSKFKKNNIPKDLLEFIEDGMSFSLRCRTDDENIDKTEMEIKLSSVLDDFFSAENKKISVNLSHPDLNFIAFIHNKKIFLFLDFAGFPLDKRDYKIFTNRLDIKGSLAFLMLKFAGYSSEKKMIDPFCKSATICIEAALCSSNISPNFFRKDQFSFIRFPVFKESQPEIFFDSISSKEKKHSDDIEQIFAFDPLLKNINAARKNAKIAEVQKSISFARVNLEDIDLKFSKEIDMICSFPPQPNKFNEKEINKIYKELFHQADLILKKNGKIALLSLKEDAFKTIPEEYKFFLEKEIHTMAGKQDIWMLLFSKKHKA